MHQIWDIVAGAIQKIFGDVPLENTPGVFKHKDTQSIQTATEYRRQSIKTLAVNKHSVEKSQKILRSCLCLSEKLC